MPQDGVIRVEDLLRSPALQLRLIAGEPGTSRRVAWAHVSELEDPTPWLFGSEMIMTTGIAVPRTAERQRGYLERLDDAGVACLALSEGLMVPPLTRAFLAAANERGFPVVEVPIPVPFMAISQEVAAAVQGDTGQRLNAQLQVFGAVQWLAAGNLSAGEIFARLERLSGYALYACTLQRGPLLEGVPVPPPGCAHLIPGTASSPPTVPGGYVLPVSGPRGTVGYVLAMESPDAAPAGVSVVQHIATVAALQWSMLAHEREMVRREGAETLAEMMQGALDAPVVARRLAARGFAAGRGLVLAVIRPRREAADSGRVAGALADAGLPHLILRQQDELFVLIHDDAPARDALTGALEATIGLSRPFPAERSLAVARREALWALDRAAEAGREVVRYGDDRTQRWLTGDSADLRALAEQVLGAVTAYDAAHAGDLVTSVRVWLEHDRQTDRAARALHIHPNTLLYRVRRFEQISGRSLASTESLAEVWLALRATAAVPVRPPGPPRLEFPGSECPAGSRAPRDQGALMAGEGPGGFVPEGFDVPRELVTTEFRLEPLGPQHNAGDYEAWTSSIDHIRATPGFRDGSWPDPGMSPEQNMADLRRHAGDFARRSGFTYTVLAGAGDRVVGCVYIYPSESGDGAADVQSWVRADRADLDVPLYQAVSAWLAEAWPFPVVRYAAR